MKEPVFPPSRPIPKYSFTVEETRELCYNQASIRLREIKETKSYSPKWFQLVKELSIYLNLLTDEQFNKLVLEFALKPTVVEIVNDSIFG